MPAVVAPLPDNRLEPARGLPGVGIWRDCFGLGAVDVDLEAHCAECGQHWYIELAPDEGKVIDFALKLPDATPPTRAAIEAQKQFLRVLAHAGFDEARCREASCPNHALAGRALCHVHWHGLF